MEGRRSEEKVMGRARSRAASTELGRTTERRRRRRRRRRKVDSEGGRGKEVKKMRRS